MIIDTLRLKDELARLEKRTQELEKQVQALSEAYALHYSLFHPHDNPVVPPA